jgi:hypothetical protein
VETATPKTEWPRRRLRLAISLRVMMVLVVVAAIPLAWVVRRARDQRDAVAVIERNGGYVVYDFQYSDGVIKFGPQRGPKWLRVRLGIDYFQGVKRVVVMREGADEIIGVLDRLPGVESINLGQTSVTDASVARLSQIPSLRDVHLGFTAIGNPGVAHLARLSKLRRLDFAYTTIADDWILSLVQCRQLEELDLTGTKLTRKGIERLAYLPNLRRVELGSIDSAEILAVLGKVRQLEYLEMDMDYRLSDSAAKLKACLGSLTHLKVLKIMDVTDEILAEICMLEGLEELGIQFSAVTDEGLSYLRGLTRLKTLDLGYSDATAAGIASLQRDMPSLKITK